MTESERDALHVWALAHLPVGSLQARYVLALIDESALLRAELQRIYATTAHVKMGRTADEVCDKVIRASDELMTLRDRACTQTEQLERLHAAVLDLAVRQEAFAGPAYTHFDEPDRKMFRHAANMLRRAAELFAPTLSENRI